VAESVNSHPRKRWTSLPVFGTNHLAR